MPDLDFQPRRPGLVAVVAFLGSLLLAADAWHEEALAGDRLAEIEATIAQVQRRQDRMAASQRQSQPENVFSPEEVTALNQAYTAIGVDWEGLYGAVDAAVSEDVALVAIRPSAAGKTVQISGEARNMAAALAFADALRRKPLAQVVLVSHQIKQNDAQRPIVFEIAALWRPAS